MQRRDPFTTLIVLSGAVAASTLAAVVACDSSPAKGADAGLDSGSGGELGTQEASTPGRSNDAGTGGKGVTGTGGRAGAMGSGGADAGGASTIRDASVGTEAATPREDTGSALLASSVSAGTYFACAVTLEGAAECWGLVPNGVPYGSGKPFTSTVPVPIASLEHGVAAVASGSYFACALSTLGAVSCWGQNTDGQLGNGTTTNSATPVPVMGLQKDVVAISVGTWTACAIKKSGALWCWGNGDDGQLGDGKSTTSTTPVQVSGLTSGVTSVSVGNAGVCAVAGGAVMCWGNNNSGDLGKGVRGGTASLPGQVTDLTSDMKQVSLAIDFACAVSGGGDVSCWGQDDVGQLGNDGGTHGSTCASVSVPPCSLTPIAVQSLPLSLSSLSAFNETTCGITSKKSVLCWGANAHGLLGTAADHFTTQIGGPVPVTGLESGVTALSVGSSACAIKDDHTVWCWGYNGFGELGNGATSTMSGPTPVRVH